MRRTRTTALAAVSLTAALVLSGCTGGGESSDEGGTTSSAPSQAAEKRSALQVMAAATKKTTEAKSARLEMTMTAPGMPEAMEMQGVMSWDPVAMDFTMSGEAFAGAAGEESSAPSEMRMVWLDDVMYMYMGEVMAADTGGKTWMKFDIEAMVEEAGDEALADQMTAGLDEMGRSPAEQMALLLDSPNIEHVGEEKLDGAATQHYQGSITLEELLEIEAQNSASGEYLTEEKRAELLDGMDESGIEAMDLDVWLNEDDMPVQMTVVMDSPEGSMEMTQRMTDYGVKVAPEAPPADETIDFVEMLEELGGPGALEPGAV
ncbi:hypothetical protein GCM10023347_26980 [Streptomyces chumphonensis]|uniref:Lipoprotein n=1 Tax=Streptomyces chumphonensis TaxID=1214925 RepID=A0A927ICX2_9ACTN|nr:hypothetical protein [Streptomyces chumphonensis]MBD3932507.1 hypothetical protein [Streptomyces chumphonensis]